MKALTQSEASLITVTVNINNPNIIKTIHEKYFYTSNGVIYGKNDGTGYKSYTKCVNEAFKLNTI